MNSRTRSEEHEPDLVSLAVAAESLGVSVKTIRRRISGDCLINGGSGLA